jgi:glycine cleavage system H protein
LRYRAAAQRFKRNQPSFCPYLFFRRNAMTMRYSEDHVWLRIEGDAAVVGLTQHAQDALGDVVFVDLPKVGTLYAQKDVAGVVESVKAAADVYMPVSGTVLQVNEALQADPSLANSDPQGAGWLFRLKLADADQWAALMDEAAYAVFEKNASS